MLIVMRVKGVVFAICVRTVLFMCFARPMKGMRSLWTLISGVMPWVTLAMSLPNSSSFSMILGSDFLLEKFAGRFMMR